MVGNLARQFCLAPSLIVENRWELLRLVPALRDQEDFSLGPSFRVALDGKNDVSQRKTRLDVGLKLGAEEFLDAAG